ncbi:MAG: MFS transporter, partial [Pedobacter sp.]
LCAVPVLLIGTSQSYTSFLLFRLAIGVIGASFVITQFHTSIMFAPNIKGTANATAGGFGNAGGGAANVFMPLIASALTTLGFCSSADSWRYAMIFPGVMLLVCAFLYYRYTQDSPHGNFKDLKDETIKSSKNTFLIAAKDYRTWILTIAYAACFGVEITVDNFAPIFFTDSFGATIAIAGLVAGIFGWINIFARPMGGIVADKIGKVWGFDGKTLLLSILLLIEGIGLIWFAKSGNIGMAIFMMFVFGLSLKMANGATYSLVPFINPVAVGSVAGIVGAGGNIGAMLIAFMFKSEASHLTKTVIENGQTVQKDLINYTSAFTLLGYIILGIGVAVFIFRTVMAQKKAKVEELAFATSN